MRLFLTLSFLVLLFFWCHPASSAPLDDVPETHWAKQAVDYLQERGLLEGYDGKFRGERPVTRYQMAEMLARVLKRLEAAPEPALKGILTAQDLEILNALQQKYSLELRSVEPNLRNWEEMLARYETIVSEAERVRTYGNLHVVEVSQNVVGEDPSLGTPANPALDFSTGRLLAKGSVVTGVARLGVRGRLAEGLDAGAEFTATGQAGSAAVATYWGITPPYFQNAFTGSVTGNRADVDNVWVTHTGSRTALFFGAFLPKTIKGHLFYGEPNPVTPGPPQLPLGGLDITGNLGGKTPITVEVLAARLAQGSPYTSRLVGIHLTGNIAKGTGGLGFLRAANSGAGNAGQVPLPTTYTWQGKSGPQTGAGPQEEDIWGLEWSRSFSSKVHFRFEYAYSRYLPDRSNQMYEDRVHGNLLSGRLFGEAGEFRWGAQYLSVDSTYDPFLLPYPVPPNIPVLVPYSTYYANYYQLHDSKEFPNNRQGIRLNVTYLTRKGEIRGSFERLTQKDPSTPQNLARPGMVESLFPMISASGSEGGIENTGLTWAHSVSDTVSLSAGFYHYGIIRASTVPQDRVNLFQDNRIIRLQWSPDQLWSAFLGYQQIQYRGYVGSDSLDVIQLTPSLGLTHALSPTTTVEILFRWLTFQNKILAQGNWHGTQGTVRLESRF